MSAGRRAPRRRSRETPADLSRSLPRVRAPASGGKKPRSFAFGRGSLQHALGLRGDLLAGLQLASARSLEQRRIGDRIPQIQRQPRGDVVAVRRVSVGEFRVEETRRFQGEKHDAFDRDLGSFCLRKLPLDIAAGNLRRSADAGTPPRQKRRANCFSFSTRSGRAWLRAARALRDDPPHAPPRRSPPPSSRLPLLRNARAALVADAASRPREKRLHDHHRPASFAAGAVRRGIVSSTPCGGFQRSSIDALLS